MTSLRQTRYRLGISLWSLNLSEDPLDRHSHRHGGWSLRHTSLANNTRTYLSAGRVHRVRCKPPVGLIRNSRAWLSYPDSPTSTTLLQYTERTRCAVIGDTFALEPVLRSLCTYCVRVVLDVSTVRLLKTALWIPRPILRSLTFNPHSLFPGSSVSNHNRRRNSCGADSDSGTHALESVARGHGPPSTCLSAQQRG